MDMEDYKLDKTDCSIIGLLQKDGRMSNTEIAKKVGITEATVRNRLQKLLKNEVFQIVAVCDPFKVGFKIVGNIKIKIQFSESDHIIEELQKIDELWYIAQMSGQADLDVEFKVKSLQHLRDLLYTKINKIKGITHTETSFHLGLIKNRHDWGTAFDQEP